MFAPTSSFRPPTRATIRGKVTRASSRSRSANASRRKRHGDTFNPSEAISRITWPSAGTDEHLDALPLQGQGLVLVGQRQREGVQRHRLGVSRANPGMSEDREPALLLRRKGGRRLRRRGAPAETRYALVLAPTVR